MNLHLGRGAVLDELAAVVCEIQLTHPVRVAINGVDGAGKTRFADELVAPCLKSGREIIRASIDGFHNPRSIRYARGRLSPEGYFRDSFDNDALLDSLLRPLGPNGSRLYRTAVFDWRSDAPVISPQKRATSTAILILDGIFLFRPELQSEMDLKVFLDVTEESACRRCAERDGSSPDIRSESHRRYLEGQRLYFLECNPKAQADAIIDNNDLLQPVLIWNQRGVTGTDHSIP